MNYCKLCCQPDTRPRIEFKDGVCGACLYEQEKEYIDWDKRMEELWEIAKWAAKEGRRRKTYACALGVSGGKDSTFTALYAKQKLGLNCLLVSATPELSTEVGEYNIQNLINHGFDCIRITVNPRIQKKLMRRDFFKYLQIRKSSEYPLWSSTYTVAKEKNIPLVIQGENAALTLGVSKGINIDSDASQIFKTNTISGKRAIDEFCDTVEWKDIIPYEFPDLKGWNGKAIWLQYYLKEWSQFGNAQFAISRGMHVREDSFRNTGRIHPWSCVDSDFHIVNQMFKYFKLGFGFATDEVCYNIREKRITREEGFKLIKEFDGRCGGKYIKKFCDWLEITPQEFWDTVKRFKKYDPWGRLDGK